MYFLFFLYISHNVEYANSNLAPLNGMLYMMVVSTSKGLKYPSLPSHTECTEAHGYYIIWFLIQGCASTQCTHFLHFICENRAHSEVVHQKHKAYISTLSEKQSH